MVLNLQNQISTILESICKQFVATWRTLLLISRSYSITILSSVLEHQWHCSGWKNHHSHGHGLLRTVLNEEKEREGRRGTLSDEIEAVRWRGEDRSLPCSAGKRVKVGKGNEGPDSLHLNWTGLVEEEMDERYERNIVDECGYLSGLMALGRLPCSLSCS
jgi:hypothetical protein